jgi:hypothetical protein
MSRMRSKWRTDPRPLARGCGASRVRGQSHGAQHRCCLRAGSRVAR